MAHAIFMGERNSTRAYTSAQIAIEVAFKLNVRRGKVKFPILIRVPNESIQAHDNSRSAETAL